MTVQIANVAVFLPIDHLLSYVVPKNLKDNIEVGKRVLVPVKNSVEMGVVISVEEVDHEKGLKSIINILDHTPVLSEELINLCMWISNYYMSPPGLAVQLAVPGFLRSVGEVKYSVVDRPEVRFLPGTITHQILSVLEKKPLSKKEIKKRFKSIDVEEELNKLVREGVLKEIYVFEEPKKKVQKKWVRLNQTNLLPDEKIIEWQKKEPAKAKVYLYLLHCGNEITEKELISNLGITRGVVNSLYKEGLLDVFYKGEEFYPFQKQVLDSFLRDEEIILTDEQAKALEEIYKGIEEGVFKTFLLYGITGSGKTEVYIRSIQETILRGKQCLFLVPEISLTPQTLSRLISRFGERVAVIHSGITEKQRYGEWDKIKNGNVDIVVGVRSALFAPFKKLGLVIIDEEHEHTYKQEETPRYHARDVGIMRAKLNSAVCILGSATPSLESYVNAQRGKYQLLRLTKRVASGSLPSVEIVDLRNESKGADEILLSEVLKEKIRERLEKKEQVMLMINRRGFAPVVICPSCGWVVPCPNCRTSLNYHRKDGVVRCHYCNYKKTRPEFCEECNFSPLILLGAGTQRVEDLLAVYFPHATISRIDTDVASSQSRAYHILKEFSEGKIDILVGTQMIAKGHDYPRVTLVGVVNADVGLTLPNFRSPEFAFQLLMQVAGRTGRREYPGEVVIQTYMPNHYVIKAVQSHNYEMFFEREIRFRAKVGYPPINRMVHFGVESVNPETPPEVSYALVESCKKNLNRFDAKVIVLGPASAIYKKLRGVYRWQFAILCKDSSILKTLAREVINHFEVIKPDSKTKLLVDVDPYQIY